MSCARCGCGIYKTEEFISLNKVWHKYCFNCYQCSKRLDKDTAKIFQGELFCEGCYANVIEKLFEVLSSPSINQPCKVASTPSCAVTNINNHCVEERIRNCENILKNSCGVKEYCFPAEKKLNECTQRSVQSCSCIPSQNETKDEYCFVFPIPREVANYYNRAHMKNKACKDPVSCTQPQGTTCRCRNRYSLPSRCPVQVRTLKNQCCSSSPPRCRNISPQRCCPPTSPLIFKKGCGCCLSKEPTFCDPCSSPTRCASCNSSHPACQRCSCCQKKTQSCKTNCPPSSCCSPPRRPSSPCCPPPSCRPACRPPCLPTPCVPTPCCVLPPRCPPPQPCAAPCCLQKTEGCCYSQSSSERSKSCCRRSCHQNSSKYCVCGCLNPCNCKMSQIKAQCTVYCVRCGQKVYAAEKILVSSGAFHTSCFTCFCCKKCLDVKNVFEGCGEIYCKHCYNHFFGVEYYGFGAKNC